MNERGNLTSKADSAVLIAKSALMIPSVLTLALMLMSESELDSTLTLMLVLMSKLWLKSTMLTEESVPARMSVMSMPMSIMSTLATKLNLEKWKFC